jgi:hypothetical protein
MPNQKLLRSRKILCIHQIIDFALILDSLLTLQSGVAYQGTSFEKACGPAIDPVLCTAERTA